MQYAVSSAVMEVRRIGGAADGVCQMKGTEKKRSNDCIGPFVTSNATCVVGRWTRRPRGSHTEVIWELRNIHSPV